jgi:tetratricopeptide (TPR) repeat protein
MLFSHLGGVSAEARRNAETAHRLTDAACDPSGVAILEARIQLHQRAAADAWQRIAPLLPTRASDRLLRFAAISLARSDRRLEEAIALARFAALDWPELQGGGQLATLLSEARRPAEAVRFIRAWAASAPDSEQALLSLADVELGEGHREEASRLIERVLLVHGSSFPRMQPIVAMLITIGRLVDARRLAQELLQGGESYRARGLYRLGAIDILEGRFVDAYKQLHAGLVLAEPLGGQGEAVQILDSLRALAPLVGSSRDEVSLAREQETVFARLGMKTFAALARFEQALLAADRKSCPSIDAALEPFTEVERPGLRPLLTRAAAERSCAQCSEVVRLGLSGEELSTRFIYSFAACAEAEGRADLAREAFKRASRFGLGMQAYHSPYHSVLARFRLARLHERSGDAAAAKAAYEDFLGFWGGADRSIAEVDQAREALARLAPAGPR